MTLTEKKLKPRVINYRSYKHFLNEVLWERLLENSCQQTFVNNYYGFEKFCNITLKILDAPCKAKHARGNQIPFMTKDLCHKKHPSILAIRTKCNRNGVFSLREVNFK